jgi:hypothetical protein
MRKNRRKLFLNRETLRQLGGSSLRNVAGGDSVATSCECIIPTGCDCATQGQPDCYDPTLCLATCSLTGVTCRHR